MVFFFVCFYYSSVCFFSNGFLTSIMTFSCMPYGAFTYHLAVSLSEAANPIACLIGPNLPEAGRYSIFSVTAVISIVVAYVCTLAALSPNPPLQDSTTGIFLCVSTIYNIFVILFKYYNNFYY